MPQMESLSSKLLTVLALINLPRTDFIVYKTERSTQQNMHCYRSSIFDMAYQNGTRRCFVAQCHDNTLAQSKSNMVQYC